MEHNCVPPALWEGEKKQNFPTLTLVPSRHENPDSLREAGTVHRDCIFCYKFDYTDLLLCFLSLEKTGEEGQTRLQGHSTS